MTLRPPRLLWLVITTVLLVVAAVGVSLWAPYHHNRAVAARFVELGAKEVRFIGDRLPPLEGREPIVGVANRPPPWIARLAPDWKPAVFDRVVQLDLEKLPVTDADLAGIGSLASLHDLSLNGTRVTDAGLAHLRGLPEIVTLYLAKTAVTDAGMEDVSTLHSLEHLSLRRTAVGDAGLPPIGTMTSLERLYLSATQVTSAGLGHLKGLTNLKTLQLFEDEIDAASVEDLKTALPELHVMYSPPRKR
jgi:hypothetical protein